MTEHANDPRTAPAQIQEHPGRDCEAVSAPLRGRGQGQPVSGWASARDMFIRPRETGGGKVPLRVLFFEDDPDDIELSLLALKSSEFDVTADVVSKPQECLERLRSNRYDVILSDYRMPNGTGMDMFASLKAAGITTPFILVTGSLGDEMAVACLKDGVADYVIKDRLARLPVSIRRALEGQRMREQRAEAEQALRRSEAGYRSLIQSAPCGVLRMSADTGCLLEANTALAEMLGYSSAGSLLESSLAGDIALDPAVRRRLAEECSQGGGSNEAEVQWKRKDGSTVCLQLRGRLLIDPQNGAAIFEMIAENITDRRRAEERIRQLNRLYSVLSSSGQAIVRIRHRDALLTEICRIIVEQGSFEMAWLGMLEPGTLRVKPAAFAGVEAGYLDRIEITAGDEPAGNGPVGTAIRDKRHVLVEDIASDPRMGPWRKAALARRYHSVAAFPICVRSLAVGALAIYAQDRQYFDPDFMTLLDELAANVSFALESMEVVEELSQFFALSLDMLCICGMDGSLRRVNPAWQKTLGFEESELESKHLMDLFHSRDHAHVAAALQALQSGRAVNWLEARIISKSGSQKWILGNAIPVPRQGIFFAALRDNTERQRLEAELSSQNLQLEEQNRRIEAASRMKSEFLANMSHELRSPLNGIIGFTEILHDGRLGVLPIWATELLGRIHKSAIHLLQLINGVLDLSKIEAGHLNLSPEPVSVSEVVQEVTGSLSGLADDRRIRIISDVSPDVDPVTTDPARLKQVLYNYVSNAIKFTDEGGTVTVRVRPEGMTQFCLEVSDTGVGISEKDKARLFVEFEQLDSTTAKRHGGTGLGLAVTRRIVEAQGGQVGVRSVLGEGSTFFAILPRAPGQFPPHCTTVLIVEDDKVNRYLLAQLLGKAGYLVETATTCAEAVAKCRERAFDAITLDLLLPDAPGWEALKTIRAMDQHRRTPVIVISTVEQDHIVIPDDVSAFLTKPADAEQIARALAGAGVRPTRLRSENG